MGQCVVLPAVGMTTADLGKSVTSSCAQWAAAQMLSVPPAKLVLTTSALTHALNLLLVVAMLFAGRKIIMQNVSVLTTW